MSETEQVYNPKAYALELGFSEEDAEIFGDVNANATNLRRLAETRRAKGLMGGDKKEPDTATTGSTVTTTKPAKEAPASCPVCGKNHKAGSGIAKEHAAEVEAEAVAKANAEAEEEAKAQAAMEDGAGGGNPPPD